MPQRRWEIRGNWDAVKRWIGIATRAAACAVVLALLSGCAGSPDLSSESTTSAGSEKLVLHSDGTFNQTITCKSGKSGAQHGNWETVHDNAYGVPGVPTDGSYIKITDKLDIQDYCSAHPSQMKTTGFEPKGFYRASSADVKNTRQEVLGWALFLRLVGIVIWIWGIVDVCMREFPGANGKVGWLLCVALLGCLGTVIYLIFGRASSWKIGEAPES